MVKKRNRLYWRRWDGTKGAITRASCDPKGVLRGKLDPRYTITECEFGEIFPHGGDILSVEFDGHCKTKSCIGRLPISRLHQEGDDFGSIRFHVKDFDEIAKIVKSRP